MATRSILKTIQIKDARPARALVNALEHASGKAEKPVVMQKGCSEASREEIRKMFEVESADDGV